MQVRPSLRDIAGQLDGDLVTRFAPSPTGYLHLGHVVNAIYVWGVARAIGGEVLLRIEDHDRVRSRPHFEKALLEDLDWLGFTPDRGRHPVLRQSDRPHDYERAFEHLRTTGRVYACACSRKDINGARYENTCRSRGLEASRGRGLRVEIPEGAERFVDGLFGPRTQTPADDSGDELLRDRDGHWTYQFSVAVDDYRDGVTLVIRGADLLESSARQLRLARMLGRPTPVNFLHHPLLISPAGRKLSKANRDSGIRDLREAGISAAAVIGMAAARIGLLDAPRQIQASDVSLLFG